VVCSGPASRAVDSPRCAGGLAAGDFFTEGKRAGLRCSGCFGHGWGQFVDDGDSWPRPLLWDGGDRACGAGAAAAIVFLATDEHRWGQMFWGCDRARCWGSGAGLWLSGSFAVCCKGREGRMMGIVEKFPLTWRLPPVVIG
jgi:hypothetical protein